MLRATYVVILVALAWIPRDAQARMIVRPSVARSCPLAPSWSKVTACLKRFGKVTVRSERKGVKLVELADDGTGAGRFVEGLYLYAQQSNGAWRIGGMRLGSGYQTTPVAPYTIGSARGYRFDVSGTRRDWVSMGGIARESVQQTTIAVFCTGDSVSCVNVVTACDIYVDGGVYNTFRGELTYGDGAIDVEGDRAAAGQLCEQPGRVFVRSARENDIEPF